MAVADRKGKTVRELCNACTSSEIRDWIEFYALRDKWKAEALNAPVHTPEKGKPSTLKPKPPPRPGLDPLKVRYIFANIRARQLARKGAKRDSTE